MLGDHSDGRMWRRRRRLRGSRGGAERTWFGDEPVPSRTRWLTRLCGSDDATLEWNVVFALGLCGLRRKDDFFQWAVRGGFYLFTPNVNRSRLDFKQLRPQSIIKYEEIRPFLWGETKSQPKCLKFKCGPFTAIAAHYCYFLAFHFKAAAALVTGWCLWKLPDLFLYPATDSHAFTPATDSLTIFSAWLTFSWHYYPPSENKH